MPFVHVAWLPKACRTAEVRKEVASAVIKALTSVKSAEITPDKVVVRFSESVDGFALPAGHTHENVHLPVEKKK
jgi:phenylpyruvate tautomerase PptA (4-oxalocrotonate tautomerase family)